MAQRRLPEAEALLRRALTLTPDDAALHADLCEALYYGHAYADALAACDRALALDPGHPFAEEHRQQIQIIGAGGQTVAMRRLANQRAHPIPFDGFLRARLFARLGQRDSALAYVERAVAERAFMAPFLNPNPLFDPYRDDPRWIAAVHRMGLE